MNELFESHVEFILQKFGVKQVHKGESLGGGGNSHMKQTGMLVVSLRGVNFVFCSCLGCSRQSANILSCQGLI